MPDPALRALADDYWDAVVEEGPTFASLVGDRRFDDRIEDLSFEAEARQQATWTALRRRLDGLDDRAWDPVDRVTSGLLAEELHVRLLSIEHRTGDQAWDQMDGIHATLLAVAPQINAPSPENAADLVTRYRQVGTFLDQACDRFRRAIASGRTPPRIVVERSLNMLDGYLASPLDDDGFVTMDGPVDWDGEAAWRDELRSVTAEVIRPAMARYRAVIADELAPVARDDDHPGLQWVPGGPEQYRALIRVHTGLDLDPVEVHETGMRELTEKLPREYAEIGGRLLGVTDQTELFPRLRTDADLRYRTGDEVMADATRCVESAAAAMAGWFGRLPQAGCEIKPVPDFLAPDSPGAYYFPPASDGSRPGTYYVNLYEPEGKHRYETAAIAFHEAIPGHHLQLAIGTELDGLPQFQRLSYLHNAFAEGWGLYSERLAEEMGLYRDDMDRLGMLTADSLRSARLVVDTGLHALGWTRQQAIDFMVANVPSPEQELIVEVDRYIAMPAQALSYKIGQLEIFRLRDEAEAAMGQRFDIKAFHDVVLGSSTVSLPVLRELVADHVGR
jgi:uncharacterized protein (DUF885 family)